jgi:hypothetical protein
VGPTRNGFQITLTGARAVTLDTRRMRLQDWRPVTGRVSSNAPFALTLRGHWSSAVSATIDGASVAVRRVPGAIVVLVPAGRHSLSIAG